MVFGRLLRSASVRLGLGYALVFGVSALLLISVIRYASLNILNQQVDAAIDADAQGLAEAWNNRGPDAFIDTINNRIASSVDDDAIYAVVDGNGRVFAGNTPSWPPEVTQVGADYEVPLVWNGRETLARFHRYDLPGHTALLVGRDMTSRKALRNLLTKILAWSLAMIALLCVGGAVALQKLFTRMVSQVSQTADAISSGDLSRRVAISGRGDEFDRMAETINDMLDRLSRLMDGVREVSNAIAHDLRTPITRARARLEDAAAHGGTEEQLRGAIERAVSDLDAITGVFQALLRISEIEAGARRSAFVTLDLRPLLEDVQDLYAAVAEEQGLSFALRATDDLWIRGDRELIQQAMANLLDNAIKFSPPGGAVLLEGERVPDGVRLVVTDAGPGIPAADIGRATERFYRGETARHTPGFGLGLTLVGAVAQLHHGRLSLEDAHPGLRAALVLPVPPDLRLGRTHTTELLSAPV